MSSTGGRLVALLLNPVPHTRVTITEKNVAAAGAVLGFDVVQISNLITLTTSDLPALNRLATDRRYWVGSRDQISQALSGADALLFGWGVGGFTGPARAHMQEQLLWLGEKTQASGVTSAYVVGGRPHHPSRWRQHTSPSHDRYDGPTFEDRLGQALALIRVEHLLPCR